MTTLLEAQRVTKIFSSGLLDRHATVALEDFSLAINSEQPSITAPPEPPETCELFLRDEFREAVRQVRLGVEREPALLTARDLQHPQLAVAHERDAVAIG